MVATAVRWLLGDKSDSVICQPWKSARVTKCSGLLTKSKKRRDVRRYRSVVCGDNPCSHISINRPCVSLGDTSRVTILDVSTFAMPYIIWQVGTTLENRKVVVGGKLEYPKTGQPERQLSALVAVRELASNEAMPQPVLQFIPAIDTSFAFC